MMIANFPKKPISNQSGLLKFDFIPVEMVAGLPQIINGVADGPLNMASNGLIYAGYATADTLSFTENQQENDQGIYYEQIINGSTPGDKPELTILMEMMANRPFFVIINDVSGKRRLVGLDRNMRFKSDYSSGQSRSEYKGYKFTFSGLSLKRAPIYPY